MKYIDNQKHIFIVGSPRSGTSLMASILQDSPVIASYRAETKLLNSCKSKYGEISKMDANDRFWRDWFNSRQFKRSGLNKNDFLDMADSLHSYVELLGRYMNLVADKQACERWIDSTPSNSYCLEEIINTFPNAKVIHMIRDGRAVALSLAKLGWAGVRTTDFDKSLYYSALKWQRAISAVHHSQYLIKSNNYHEVHYEELVLNPVEIMRDVCEFLDIPVLDERLMMNDSDSTDQSINSTLHTPNSPFGDMIAGISQKAAYRWKTVLSDRQVSGIEAYVGSTLIKSGYRFAGSYRMPWYNGVLVAFRRLLLWGKRSLKHHTILGRYASTPLEIGMD